MAKTEMVSARVEPWIKELLKNRDMTVRDALEYVARILANADDMTWEEIRRKRNEINQLELEFKRIMSRTDEIQEQIQVKENDIIELEGKLEANPNDIAISKSAPAIKAIFQIAERFHCHPVNVNHYTGHDTLNFQAVKVGVSKAVLIEMLQKEWDKSHQEFFDENKDGKVNVCDNKSRKS